MTKKKLFLFPGAHKTATSLLQAIMESHRDSLEMQGLSIARRQMFYRSGMRNFLIQKPDSSVNNREVWNGMAESVLGPSWEDKDIVISIENIFGEATPPVYNAAGNCMDNLQNIFPDRDIKVVYYIRRQDSFLESVFLQNIHRGHTEDVDSFLDKYAKEKPIDWLNVLQPVVERVGKSSVKIIPFETIKAGPKAYVVKFLRNFTNMTRKDMLSTYANIEDTNVSLSELGLRIACAGFAEIPEMRERQILTKALQREFGVNRYPRFRIPEALRVRIAEQHREANESLIKVGAIHKDFAPYYLFESDAISSMNRDT